MGRLLLLTQRGFVVGLRWFGAVSAIAVTKCWYQQAILWVVVLSPVGAFVSLSILRVIGLESSLPLRLLISAGTGPLFGVVSVTAGMRN